MRRSALRSAQLRMDAPREVAQDVHRPDDLRRAPRARPDALDQTERGVPQGRRMHALLPRADRTSCGPGACTLVILEAGAEASVQRADKLRHTASLYEARSRQASAVCPAASTPHIISHCALLGSRRAGAPARGSAVAPPRRPPARAQGRTSRRPCAPPCWGAASPSAPARQRTCGVELVTTKHTCTLVPAPAAGTARPLKHTS